MTLETKQPVPGEELPRLTKQMTLEKMKTPIWSADHPDFARSVGLSAPIATGLMSTCFMSELLTSVFGPAWVTHSRLKSRYIAPVFAGDTITVRGQITERAEDQGQIRIGAEVWCENQHGQKVTLGTATVWLDA